VANAPKPLSYNRPSSRIIVGIIITIVMVVVPAAMIGDENLGIH
jgi:hypothetical protein